MQSHRAKPTTLKMADDELKAAFTQCRSGFLIGIVNANILFSAEPSISDIRMLLAPCIKDIFFCQNQAGGSVFYRILKPYEIKPVVFDVSLKSSEPKLFEKVSEEKDQENKELMPDHLPFVSNGTGYNLKRHVCEVAHAKLLSDRYEVVRAGNASVGSWCPFALSFNKNTNSWDLEFIYPEVGGSVFDQFYQKPNLFYLDVLNEMVQQKLTSVIAPSAPENEAVQGPVSEPSTRIRRKDSEEKKQENLPVAMPALERAQLLHQRASEVAQEAEAKVFAAESAKLQAEQNASEAKTREETAIRRAETAEAEVAQLRADQQQDQKTQQLKDQETGQYIASLVTNLRQQKEERQFLLDEQAKEKKTMAAFAKQVKELKQTLQEAVANEPRVKANITALRQELKTVKEDAQAAISAAVTTAVRSEQAKHQAQMQAAIAKDRAAELLKFFTKYQADHAGDPWYKFLLINPSYKKEIIDVLVAKLTIDSNINIDEVTEFKKSNFEEAFTVKRQKDLAQRRDGKIWSAMHGVQTFFSSCCSCFGAEPSQAAGSVLVDKARDCFKINRG